MRKNLLIAVLMSIVLLVLAYALVRTLGDERKDSLRHRMLVQHVEALGKLELVRYSVQDVMEYEKHRAWLPNAKTLLVVYGEAVGCVDLAKVTDGDIRVDGDSVSITLPYPELCYCRVDHQRSRVYYMEYGLWETANLVDEAYRYAETQFQNTMAGTNMDAEVKANARKLLEPILNAMGFNKVDIRFKPPFLEGPGR